MCPSCGGRDVAQVLSGFQVGISRTRMNPGVFERKKGQRPEYKPPQRAEARRRLDRRRRGEGRGPWPALATASRSWRSRASRRAPGGPRRAARRRAAPPAWQVIPRRARTTPLSPFRPTRRAGDGRKSFRRGSPPITAVMTRSCSTATGSTARTGHASGCACASSWRWSATAAPTAAGRHHGRRRAARRQPPLPRPPRASGDEQLGADWDDFMPGWIAADGPAGTDARHLRVRGLPAAHRRGAGVGARRRVPGVHPRRVTPRVGVTPR